MNIHLRKFSQITYKYRWGIYICTLLLWGICSIYDGHNTAIGDLLYPYFVVLGIFSTINLATSIVKNDIIKMPSLLTKSSFFVYLFHFLCLGYAVRLINFLINRNGFFSMTISYLLIPFVTIALSVALYYLLKRFTPSFCGLLTGSR